jgi:hypothetical protein
MKVVVGQNTIVKKITVGTPLRVGSAANGSLTGLDDVNGTTNRAHGTILSWDSATNKFIHSSIDSAIGANIGVVDSGGLGQLRYDTSSATITYAGPSTDSVTGLFSVDNAGSPLGKLVKTDGVIQYIGPSLDSVRSLFSAAGDLSYNAATGQYSVTVPVTSAAFDSNFNAASTDSLSEGSTNLYYTDSRGRASISVTDAGGMGSVSYDQPSGTITYTGPSTSDVRNLLVAGAGITYDSATGVVSAIATSAADIRGQLVAGTGITYDSTSGVIATTITQNNFDSAQARKSITVSDAGGFGSFAYNNSTGVITYTGPSVSDVRSQLVAGTGITYDSATGVISSLGIQAADVRNQLVAGPGISYDSSTGVITNTASDTTRSDSSIRALITANGSIQYDSVSGNISFTEKSDAQIRALFNGGGDIGYDTATGVFSVNLGSVDVTDSAVTRALLSATNTGTGAGSLSYNSITGQFAFAKVTDSDIRSTLYASNVGGMGSLSYDSLSGTFSYAGVDSATIRNIFSASGDLSYNAATGQFSITTGAHFADSDARAAISVAHGSGYGSISYDQSTGVITHTGADDSNFRRAIIANDQGGLGSFTYDSQFGVMTYTGPSADSVYGQFSFGEVDGSLGKLRLDSSTGSVTFDLAKDSVRSLFQAVNTHVYDSFHGISYDSGTGVISYKGPNAVNFRGMLSVDSTIDQSLGFGRFSYFQGDSALYGGKLRYVAPTADSIFTVFKAGVGINYDSSTGTFSTDSSAEVTFSKLTVTDSATFSGSVNFNNSLAIFDSASFTNGLKTDNIVSSGYTLTIDPANDDSSDGEVVVKGGLDVTGPYVIFNTDNFETTDKRITLGKGISDSASITGGGIVVGNMPDPLFFLYGKDSNTWLASRGIKASGPFAGPTIDRIDSAIDALPDSAQVRGLISTDGNGLSYNSTTGVISFDSDADVTINTLRGPQNFIIDPAAIGDATGTVQILGNLQVEGVQTTINSTTVSINDKNIILADSAANAAAADGAGITIGGANATFQYAAGTDRFAFNKNIEASQVHATQVYADSFYGTISSIANFSTDSLSEGPTNLYYTDTRVRNAISGGAGLTYDAGTGQFLIPSSGVTAGTYGDATNVAQITVDSLGFVDTLTNVPISTVNNISFDSSTGIFTVQTATETFSTPLALDPFSTDSLSEGSTNLYFTEARARASLKVSSPQLIYDSAAGTLFYDQGNTDSVAEGSINLYYTDARARASLRVTDQGGSGSLTYDSATGGLVYVGPDKEDLKTVLSTFTSDSLGHLRWDPNYGFKVDSDVIMNQELIVGDSINNSIDFALMYSGLNDGLRKVTLSTLASKIGGGAGGGSSLFGFINL